MAIRLKDFNSNFFNKPHCNYKTLIIIISGVKVKWVHFHSGMLSLLTNFMWLSLPFVYHSIHFISIFYEILYKIKPNQNSVKHWQYLDKLCSIFGSCYLIIGHDFFGVKYTFLMILIFKSNLVFPSTWIIICL